jgi:predicted ATPase
VRAGLDLVRAISDLKTHAPLQTRVGIATGLVVVGDLIGSGASQEQAIVGETPNLAARLQGLAMPGSLVIADATRHQLGQLFDLRDLGPQPLAGFTEPQRAWLVLAEGGTVSRFEALRSAATPLVGRDEELDLLRRRWEQAKTSEGRVVLISGEPGIGKSRLAAAVYEATEDEPRTRLRWFCSPHHQGSALHPSIVQLESAAGFVRDDDGEAKRAKLRELLHGADTDEFELVAELLSLPNAATDLNLSPQRKRERLFEALLNEMEALSRRRPVLAMFEDAHWIDPTSREMLDLIVDRVRRMPVLLIVTFRPEFKQSWVGQPHVTMLALNRLDDRHVAALVLGLAGNTPLGSEVVQEIAERTDGVPLFVEELTKAVLERADQERRVAAVLSANPLPALAVPATLHASLIARLDRIGPAAKEVGQVGAVLGREFGYDLIELVAERPTSELRAGLDRLADAGLLFCRGVAPRCSYMFKHALVQDAAYGTLLRARRQELHTRVATVLEQHFADLVERQPELLAHHLTAAGDYERAVGQWLKAGQHAAARSTYREAIAHLERGISLLGSLPEGSTDREQEIELQLALGLCSYTSKGPSSREAEQAFTRACGLAERQSAARQLFQAVYGLWQIQAASGRIPSARSFSDRLLRLTDRETDSELRLQAHHSAWTTDWWSGELANADEHAEAGRRLYDPEQHRSHRHVYGGHDPGVCARQAGANSGWLLGYPEKGLALGSETLDLAESIAHPYSLALALGFVAGLHLNRREPEVALRLVNRAEALASEQRFTIPVQPGILRGPALALQGATDDAIFCLREALAELERRGATLYRPYGLAFLAEVLARRGEYTPALVALNDGFNSMKATGERWWEAELHRVNGIVLVALNKLEESQAAFEEALRVARHQKAKSLELRAAMSLARLWRDQGKVQQARELLAPVYGWFTEGFDTRDLKEAKALLEELAA